MKLFNTKTRSIDEFTPLYPPKVTFYACGPTVYDYAHIGHIRKFTNDDLLKRTLTFLGYQVEHIMNITDVGHLTDDVDDGEDKMEKGASKYKKTPQELAAYFTDSFMKTIAAVNIIPPARYTVATQHIPEMIALVEALLEKGSAYETDEAIYFDTATFPTYGALSGQKLEDKLQQARTEVHIDSQKRNRADFALWFKIAGHHSQHTMKWDSPWGEGFPGWHIECSAMSMKYLGETIDIHSGGVDHIPIHHENETAQSEAATGKEFVRFWFHTYFLLVDGIKMSKSLNNFYTVDDIMKKGIDPIAMRYLCMQTHYRQTLNFTWESLTAAETALNKLRAAVIQLRAQTQRTALSEEKLDKVQDYAARFKVAISSDLQMPQALAVLWEVIKSNIPSGDKLDLLYSFDEVLGFGLASYEEVVHDIPRNIQELVSQRDAARAARDFALSDQLRDQLQDLGYAVEDASGGTVVKKS
jgi:cysteinyl-tRNA synthetase